MAGGPADPDENLILSDEELSLVRIVVTQNFILTILD